MDDQKGTEGSYPYQNFFLLSPQQFLLPPTVIKSFFVEVHVLVRKFCKHFMMSNWGIYHVKSDDAIIDLTRIIQ